MSSIIKKFSLLFGRSDVVVMDAGSVSVIRGMQRDLDAYQTVFVNLVGYLGGKFGKKYKPCILEGLAESKYVNDMLSAICRKAFDVRQECDELKAENEELKKRLYILEQEL